MANLVDQLVPERIRSAIDAQRGEQNLWLVGGALRDHFFGLSVPDLDFAVAGEAAALSRTLADALAGDWYELDAERDAARVLLEGRTLDFAAVRADDIEGDLAARDFTLNAMAVDLAHPEALIDPLGGLQHLKDRRLVATSETAIADDPIRALRAVRLACEHELEISRATRSQLKAVDLTSVSPERVRDELLRLLRPDHARCSLRVMDQLGLLTKALPDIESIRRRPHAKNRTLSDWQRTLRRAEAVAELLQLIGGERTENAIVAEAVLALRDVRESLAADLQRSLSVGRNLSQLLVLAALLLEAESADGTMGDLSDPWESPAVAALPRRLRLSRQELRYLARARVGGSFMRRHDPATAVDDAYAFEYFEATGAGGVGGVLLMLGEALATPPLSLDDWRAELALARALLEARYLRYEEVLQPPVLVRGDELMDSLGIGPGPEVGRLLRLIQHRQVAGEIHTKAQALELARAEVVRASGGRG